MMNGQFCIEKCIDLFFSVLDGVTESQIFAQKVCFCEGRCERALEEKQMKSF